MGVETSRCQSIGHFFLYSDVGTRSSTNGSGTGFTLSENPVNWRWSFPVRRKVPQDHAEQLLDAGDHMSVYAVCLLLFSTCT